jgi:hydrogenase large subunit
MMPQEAVSVGFWEAGRGILTHHVVLDGGRIANYQIVTPSTWMASPQDPLGVPGPYEEAVINTPILEEFERGEDFTGIDILRAIRSFDPCMPCTVHLYAGGRVLHRDATTCVCGEEA